MRKLIIIGALFFVTLLKADAQFIVQRGLTFGQVIKFEKSKGSVLKADVKQGPLLKPNGPGKIETEIYKRALVFQRIAGSDTMESVYTGESGKKLDDASLVNDGNFTWRLYNRERTNVIRDSLVSSLDGAARTFVVTRKKLKKKTVKYSYFWSDPSSFPRVNIDYEEKARVPRSLQMRIDYNSTE